MTAMLVANSARRVLARRQHTCISRAVQAYYASTSSIHPVIREFAGELRGTQPTFRVEPQSIRILGKPSAFLATLLAMIDRAEKRVFISSLYIGSKEAKLISSLRSALQRNSELQVHLQLDLNRSTRPGESSTASVLLPLVQEFPDRMHVSLFRSPHLRGLMAKIVPPRFNEGWGTWHAKVYGADDEVMISGANLNNSYFTNRQDRYLHFHSHKSLAQYCFDFLKVASSFSFRLQAHSSGVPLGPHSYANEGYAIEWPNPEVHPHRIHDMVRNAFSQFQQSFLCERVEGSESSSNHVFIHPLIQAGQFGIRDEESIFARLFQHLRSAGTQRPLLDLTSGYFSLYQPYQDLILSAASVDCRVVAASPKANGFYGSAGLSGLIPEAYTLYEQRFMKAVKAAGRLWSGPPPEGQGVLLSEWAKAGWTYHAKGVWLSPDSNSSPILTLFGSTNLNARSAHLDTELSFLMIVPSEAPTTSENASPTTVAPPASINPVALSTLRQDLSQEVSRIREDTVDWQGGQRKVQFITRFLVRVLKGML
ncbi:CDP-diacylglycerol-glycerol-3-phosphate 3-phosphatidyltransferase [Coprinopsis sp. MPI-PUGE-AT-0042]|nr:CDP-diacylglycerol-glycerol-3-phosphate 3-phosphatidyltransferase [Coprinopsis sp. MPI-PUGE-AT-0042]